jgi:hypothetical protein
LTATASIFNWAEKEVMIEPIILRLTAEEALTSLAAH